MGTEGTALTRIYVPATVAFLLATLMLPVLARSGGNIAEPGAPKSPREPKAEGYDNTKIPFARKFVGDDLRETLDPSGNLDNPGVVSETLANALGMEEPPTNPVRIAGNTLQNLTGEYDKTDEEALAWLEENDPNVSHLIDMEEDPEGSYKRVNQYYKRMLEHQQVKTGHGSYVPELRQVMVANAPNNEVATAFKEADDSELLKKYAQRAYKNQGGAPPLADVIDDARAEGKKRFEQFRNQHDNIVTAEGPEDLAKKGNKLEEHIRTAKENGNSPEMLIHYEDEDTGADLMFASPEKLDKYLRERRWRDLSYKDRTVAQEWFTGAAFRSNLGIADLAAELSQFIVRNAEAMGLLPKFADRLREFQKTLSTIRRKSSVRESDDVAAQTFLAEEGKEGAFGQGVVGSIDPAKVSGMAGEVFGVSLPGVAFGMRLIEDDHQPGSTGFPRSLSTNLKENLAGTKLASDSRHTTPERLPEE